MDHAIFNVFIFLYMGEDSDESVYAVCEDNIDLQREKKILGNNNL